MTDYPYIKTPGKLKEFLQKIPAMGVPKSVSTRWLPKVGFKSANHRPIIRIMDFLGFINSNKPTERWRSYLVTKNARRVLAEGIAEGYGELFDAYPDAELRSDAELKVFFQKHIATSDQAVNSTIGTFKALCSLADFKRKKAANTSSVATHPECCQSAAVGRGRERCPDGASASVSSSVSDRPHRHSDSHSPRCRCRPDQRDFQEYGDLSV